ncbi:hypothetical protein ACRRTK_023571 [Alexandromys fortis]
MCSWAMTSLTPNTVTESYGHKPLGFFLWPLRSFDCQYCMGQGSPLDFRPIDHAPTRIQKLQFWSTFLNALYEFCAIISSV